MWRKSSFHHYSWVVTFMHPEQLKRHHQRIFRVLFCLLKHVPSNANDLENKPSFHYFSPPTDSTRAFQAYSCRVPVLEGPWAGRAQRNSLAWKAMWRSLASENNEHPFPIGTFINRESQVLKVVLHFLERHTHGVLWRPVYTCTLCDPRNLFWYWPVLRDSDSPGTASVPWNRRLSRFPLMHLPLTRGAELQPASMLAAEHSGKWES